jgi:hypothetical protein
MILGTPLIVERLRPAESGNALHGPPAKTDGSRAVPTELFDDALLADCFDPRATGRRRSVRARRSGKCKEDCRDDEDWSASTSPLKRASPGTHWNDVQSVA